MNEHIILGVHVTERMHQVQRIQQLFSDYGCHIKTRIGLHEVSNGMCSAGGVIVLEMVGGSAKAQELQDHLAALDGVYVQKMVFDHPK